ncbi:MAG: M3 family oligoendopeptidase [Anaerolineales bacterium]|jgi:oligoendopeptidase F
MTKPIYEQSRWSLDELFPSADSKELRKAREQAEKQTQAFEALRPKLTSEIEPKAFVEILKRYEESVRRLSRLVYYSHLLFSEDTQDQQAQILQAQMQQLMAEIDNRTMFFKLWWKGLDDKVAERLMEVSGDDRYWLEALRLQIPHTLSEPEERVVNLKDVNGPEALVTLYDSITNRYTFSLEVEGEAKELTRGELQVHVYKPDADLRKAAYQELFRVYQQDSPILGQIYQYRVRDWYSEKVGLRGYKTPISVRNLANDVPDEVVETLLDVCQKNRGLFHRFFALKARILGLDRLRRYDIYAPVVKSSKSFPFAEGAQLVLDSFDRFDPKVGALARRLFDQQHIDSEVRKGKRSGAFCATVEPDLTPWVLANYQGQVVDVATLAHELGHAIHSLLADHHSALTQGPSLPLAETASTFGEMLLVDHLLDAEPEPELVRDLLFRQMDDAYGTIMRQAYFALFERTMHDMVREGGSVDDLSQAYLDNLSGQFGNSLDLSDDFRFEWMAIPHFLHAPFYVYAYAFGQLLVLSLYRQYRTEGESFKPRYLKILAAGGSDSPARILERAEIDIGSADFWQGGFGVLGDSLKRLESLGLPK